MSLGIATCTMYQQYSYRNIPCTLLCWSLPMTANFISESGLPGTAAETGEALQWQNFKLNIDHLKSQMKYCLLDSKYITLKVLVCIKNNAITIIHATIYHTSRCLHSHGPNSFRFLYCFRWWNRHIRHFWEYPLSFLELKVLPVE